MEEVLLPANGPWSFKATLGLMKSHLLDECEQVDLETFTLRRVLTFDNEPHLIQVKLSNEGVWLSQPNPQTMALVRWWFDLDQDMNAVDRHLARDSMLRDQVHEHPGIRLSRYPDPFEAAIVTVIGQQVSLSAARTFANRLVATFGSPTRFGLRSFPTAEILAQVPPEDIQSNVGVTHSRSVAITAVSQALSDVASRPGPLDESTLARLWYVRGIGKWSIDYLRLRASTETNVALRGDAALRRVLPEDRENHMREKWDPFTSYGVFRAWHLSVPLF